MLKIGKKSKTLAVAVLTVVAVWLAVSAFVAWKFTRRSREPFAEPAPNVAWAKLETVRLKTCDNQRIGGWLACGEADKPCVLLLHGNGDSRSGMLPVMQHLAEAKFTVLAISLRAHGDSSGDINDIGWSARHDVVAAVSFLREKFTERPIFVVGRSLGAAAAIFAAEEVKNDVAGYFLEQPYKDLESAVWNRLEHNLPPVFDWVAYAGLRLWAPVFLPVAPEQISPYAHIAAIPQNVPVVFVTGSADRHTRLDDVKSLVARVSSHAKLVIFEGAAHISLDQNNPKLYWATLFQLLK